MMLKDTGGSDLLSLMAIKYNKSDRFPYLMVRILSERRSRELECESANLERKTAIYRQKI